MRLSGMEPFTLVLWLMMGQRFEETRIESLHRAECRQFMEIMASRGRARCIMERQNDRLDPDSRRARLRRLRDLSHHGLPQPG